MAFEDYKNRKMQFGNPYADYEYYGKHSRRTWPSLVFCLVISIGLAYLAWHRWNELKMAEIMGDTVSLTRVEWALYQISGKWGLLAILILFSIGFIWLGIFNYRRLEKMRAV
jgi:uncharacterized membrane protein YidH (DUF202 family)